MARRGAREDPKIAALRGARCLNPHPEAVTDEAFLSREFFDARDAVQVKYEMVRRVRVDGESVTSAAAAFGYSRPSYYEAAAALDEQGLDGLVPGKPGPKRRHKLTDEMCAFADERLAADPSLRAADLVEPIEARFGVRVHPRSIERALARFREAHSKSR
jgi:transposase